MGVSYVLGRVKCFPHTHRKPGSQARHDGLAFGTLPLNLIGFPAQGPDTMESDASAEDGSAGLSASGLTNALKSLVPLLRQIDLGANLAGEVDLQPRKVILRLLKPHIRFARIQTAAPQDYELNRLLMSPLQVPDGTVLVLDETNLQLEPLNGRGQQNLRALQVFCEIFVGA